MRQLLWALSLSLPQSASENVCTRTFEPENAAVERREEKASCISCPLFPTHATYILSVSFCGGEKKGTRALGDGTNFETTALEDVSRQSTYDPTRIHVQIIFQLRENVSG